MSGIQYLALTACILGGPAALADEKSEIASEKITVKEATWKDVQKFVAGHKGKVVIVDFWSTSCLPCMKEYPNLVKLNDQYGDDIVCVSFNLDYAGIKSKPPAYYLPRVQKFLQSRKSALPNFMSTVEAIEVFDALEINSIPAVFVYGRDGNLAKKFDESLLKDGDDEPFTYAKDISPFVSELMK